MIFSSGDRQAEAIFWPPPSSAPRVDPFLDVLSVHAFETRAKQPDHTSTAHGKGNQLTKMGDRLLIVKEQVPPASSVPAAARERVSFIASKVGSAILGWIRERGILWVCFLQFSQTT